MPRSDSLAVWTRSTDLPRPTVLRDTALQVEDCKEVKDGRGRWDGRGPVGARPPRWRRRAHARAAAADVGTTQTGDGAAAPAGRGPGAGLARAGCDRGRAERLARPVHGRG